MPRAMEAQAHSLTPEYSNGAVERMYVEWDAALSSNDPARLLACYAADAVLESPLVPH
ncbi:MAG TPA: nuclear transport factor 2 family protein [Acidobacteriaceae bacterium]